MTTSKRHFVGHIQSAGGPPQNVELVASERPDLTNAEKAAGIGWVDQRYDPGNALRYGATGDGVTDDTAAFASMALVGGELFVPDGTYISTGVTFAKAANLTLSAGAIIEQASGNNQTMFTVTTDDFHIHGGTIDFDRANNATIKFIADFAVAQDNISFRNINLNNCSGDAIRMVGGKNWTLEDNIFTNNLEGAFSGICAIGGENIDNLFVHNNTVDSTGITANSFARFKIRGEDDGGAKVIGLRFTENYLLADEATVSPQGITLAKQAERCEISDNTVIGGLIGISCGAFAGSDVAADGGLTGCTITGNNCISQKNEGIELALNARNNVVSDNTIDGNGNADNGILISGSGVAPCIQNTITNNNIRGFVTRGISAASGADENTINNNDIFGNISSAADAIRLTNASKNNAVKNNKLIGFETTDALIALDNCAGVDISGNTLNDAQVDSVKLISASADTFVDGDVNTGTDRITLSDHFYADSQAVTLTSSGTLPAGLALATTYYVKSIDKDTIELYTTAALSVIVDITAAAGGGTHTITRDAVNIRVTNNQSFNAGTAFFRNAGSQVIGVETRITNNIGVETQTFTAADATPSVLIGDSFESSTTGVTITQFNDGYEKQNISIISKGATVYDTSTATRLIGSSVDITTASGDVTTWVCETGGTTSSVWRLTGFVDVSVDNSAGA